MSDPSKSKRTKSTTTHDDNESDKAAAAAAVRALLGDNAFMDGVLAQHDHERQRAEAQRALEKARRKRQREREALHRRRMLGVGSMPGPVPGEAPPVEEAGQRSERAPNVEQRSERAPLASDGHVGPKKKKARTEKGKEKEQAQPESGAKETGPMETSEQLRRRQLKELAALIEDPTEVLARAKAEQKEALVELGQEYMEMMSTGLMPQRGEVWVPGRASGAGSGAVTGRWALHEPEKKGDLRPTPCDQCRKHDIPCFFKVAHNARSCWNCSGRRVKCITTGADATTGAAIGAAAVAGAVASGSEPVSPQMVDRAPQPRVVPRPSGSNLLIPPVPAPNEALSHVAIAVVELQHRVSDVERENATLRTELDTQRQEISWLRARVELGDAGDLLTIDDYPIPSSVTQRKHREERVRINRGSESEDDVDLETLRRRRTRQVWTEDEEESEKAPEVEVREEIAPETDPVAMKETEKRGEEDEVVDVVAPETDPVAIQASVGDEEKEAVPEAGESSRVKIEPIDFTHIADPQVGTKENPVELD